MPSVKPELTVKSLAEVAWLLSRIARQMVDSETEPDAIDLRLFWQSSRRLQRAWDEFLHQEVAEIAADESRLMMVATQSLTTEMLTRVWATILGKIDRATGRQDLTRIATNTLNGLMQIRHRLQSILLDQALRREFAADLDRLRRRCDRWTDLLIGHLCGCDEFFDFAYDPERAKDFAEESQDSTEIQRPVELLVAAGVRLSFLGQLPELALDDPAFESMVQSILGNIPTRIFSDDGTLPAELCRRMPHAEPDPSQDVLLPGITLNRLRERFS